MDPDPLAPKSSRDKTAAQPRRGLTSRRLAAVAAAAAVAGLGVAGYFLLADSGPIRTSSNEARPAITLQPSERIVFNGLENEVKSAPGNSVAQRSAARDNATVLIRSTTGSAAPTGTTGGVHVLVPSSELAELAGRRVRVTAWARAAETDPSSRFALAFSGGNVSSGWIVFTPTGSFRPYSFDLVLPKAVSQQAAIGLWADIDGSGGGIELRLLTLRPLN